MDRDHIKCLSNLRISSHKLRIETGRYENPCIPASDRICQNCDLLEVENEIHFCLRCKLFIKERTKLFTDLGSHGLTEAPWGRRGPKSDIRLLFSSDNGKWLKFGIIIVHMILNCLVTVVTKQTVLVAMET